MSKDAVKTVKVKLLKSHQHGQMQYSEGMEIDVPEHDAAWLKNLKIAEDATKNSASPSKPLEDKSA
ncbi:DUF7210 family protein [Acinetobacter nematophilus]|uniref:DUF7210 domain-containing protein n=1 Tax=Acinetobacter nematophilus TaxID=2994642 RepID=A0A9X3IGQ2_9GAMM|nr:hypothetical protein [Acinetobacter nematophilus]MCX5466494.1 hypothetical protein [Acinetobacter nematophilus]